MKIKSLGLETDLIYPRHSGQVLDCGDYMVVKTPLRPHYFWGNYLIMPEGPQPGDLAKWQALYNSEFDSIKQGFMTFAIDLAAENNEDTSKGIAEFITAGFTLKRNLILTAQKVSLPKKWNPQVSIRVIQSEAEWAQVAEVHFSDEWYLNPDSQTGFLAQQVQDWRELSQAGIGKRFGAFLGDQLVADLGIYTTAGLGRFNEVATHRNFRRQGYCATLVYEAAKMALQNMGITTLVMEADENYHAAKIYESVGFKPTSQRISLEWFDPAMHG